MKPDLSRSIDRKIATCVRIKTVNLSLFIFPHQSLTSLESSSETGLHCPINPGGGADDDLPVLPTRTGGTGGGHIHAGFSAPRGSLGNLNHGAAAGDGVESCADGASQVKWMHILDAVLHKFCACTADVQMRRFNKTILMIKFELKEMNKFPDRSGGNIRNSLQ